MFYSGGVARDVGGSQGGSKRSNEVAGVTATCCSTRDSYGLWRRRDEEEGKCIIACVALL